MKWEEVIKTPDYQKLSPPEKLEWRKEYFNDIVKPQIRPEEYESNWQEFSADADQIEGVKPQENIQVNQPSSSNEDMVWINTDTGKKENPETGVLTAFSKGRYGSALAALSKAYAPDSEQGKKVAQIQKENWQPQTRAEKIAYGLGGIVQDLPVYAAGAAIGGPGGSFALPAALKRIRQINR